MRQPTVVWTPWPHQGAFFPVSDIGGAAAWVDNQTMVVQSPTPSTGVDLIRIQLETGAADTIVSGPGDENRAAVSPSGEWLAFVSNRTGLEEVYVTRIDGAGLPIPVSRGGGTDPVWSARGDELLYQTGGWIVSVEVEASSTDFEVLAAPDSLFSGPYLFDQQKNWDVLPDGRFLMIKGDPRRGRELEVVQNWFEELVSGTE